MSHALKVILKIVLQRVRRKLIPEIPENEYGFMKDRGIRNAIFVLKMLCEIAIEHQQDLYLVFIDYKKAFDRVKHKELFEMLRGTKRTETGVRNVTGFLQPVQCNYL